MSGPRVIAAGVDMYGRPIAQAVADGMLQEPREYPAEKGRIDFGHWVAEVWRKGGKPLSGPWYWHDSEGNRYTETGQLVGAPTVRRSATVSGSCGVERRYVGGPMRPLPYARRLDDLRRDQLAGPGPWWALLRVYAGRGAWTAAKAALGEPEGPPLVVLPPGDDPMGFDWAPLGRWQYRPWEVAALMDAGLWRRGGFAPRPGDGYWVVVDDPDADLDEDTKDAVAALCLRAGCSGVSVLGDWSWCVTAFRPVIDYRTQRAGATT